MMNYHILIKFGAREHMERLLNEGEVYMNTLAYYRDEEKNCEKNDPNEGIKKILQMNGALLKRKNPENGKHETIATLTNCIGRIKNSNLDKVAVYCLFHLLIPDEKEIELNAFVDERLVQGFGDTAVIIYDAAEFVTRVRNAALMRGLAHGRRPVEYVDMSTRDGEVGPFMKDISFSHQKELRIAVFDKETEPGPITLNIGCLKDIACLIPAQDVAELTVESCASE